MDLTQLVQLIFQQLGQTPQQLLSWHTWQGQDPTSIYAQALGGLDPDVNEGNAEQWLNAFQTLAAQGAEIYGKGSGSFASLAPVLPKQGEDINTFAQRRDQELSAETAAKAYAAGNVTTEALTQMGFDPTKVASDAQKYSQNSAGQTVPTASLPGGQSSGATTGSGGYKPVNFDLSKIPAELRPMFQELQNYMNELQKRGQVLNPNVEITPEKVAEFMAQAQREIDPYYATQLKLAREGFLRSAGFASEQVQRIEKDLERKYGQQVRQIGEQAADQGFAMSGLRQEDERTLAEDTQGVIDENRRNLSFQTGSTAREYAKAFGAPDFDIPTISNAPRVLPGVGKFDTGDGPSPLYELSNSVYDGLVGEQEFQRRTAVSARASELESALRQKNATEQLRTLTI